MTKPKVLFVLHLPPPMHGAAMMGNYLKNSEVINRDFDAHFINLGTNKILSQSGKGSFKKLFTFASLIKRLRSALRKNNYDLCYMTLTSSGAGFYKDVVIVSIIKRWNKNLIYHFHNKGVSLPKNKLVDSLYRYVFRDTKSILLSRYLYPDIKQYVKPEDIFYCPNGIPPPQFQEEIEREDDLKTEPGCKVLFLSNIMQEKGVFPLLNACQIMKEKGVPFTLHFVGGWLNITEQEFMAEVKKRNLEDVIFTYGPKYGKEKETFYRNIPLLVFPTFYDVFPLVCLEAMQNNMALVTTPEGGIPEMVLDGKTGFLVPQRNAEALAEKLTLLIENPDLRREMQREGKKRYEECFTLDKWEHNMSNILRKAAGKNLL